MRGAAALESRCAGCEDGVLFGVSGVEALDGEGGEGGFAAAGDAGDGDEEALGGGEVGVEVFCWELAEGFASIGVRMYEWMDV